MDYRALAEIGAAGMTLEKKRLEVAAMNLAHMNSSIAPGQAGYRPLQVVSQSFASRVGDSIGGLDSLSVGMRWTVVPREGAPREVRDPGHPHADANGFVRYPAVDQALEMLSAMSAMRAYEANMAVMGMAKAMVTRALELGAQR